MSRRGSTRNTSASKPPAETGQHPLKSASAARDLLRGAGLVFLVALAIRLAYFLAVRHCPLFHCPTIDARDNYDLAVLYARGTWQAPLGFAYWQPPLYPMVLAAWMHAVGLGIFKMKLLQFAVGSVNCALIYLLGARVFDKRIGLIAGIAAALYGPMIYFDGELLTPTVHTFLILASVLLLLSATRNRSLGLFAATGLVFGLSMITRPEIALFVPAAVVWVFLVLRGEIRPWKLAAVCLTIVSCTALPIVPVTIRNFNTVHEFVPISSNGGLNFWIGNNADAVKTEEARPGPAWDAIAVMPAKDVPDWSQSKMDAWFYAKSMDFAKSHPLQFIGLQLRKLGQYFTAIERRRNHDLYFYRGYSALYAALIFRVGSFAFPFGIVLPLALFGMLRTKWDAQRKLILLFLVTQCLATVAFFVCARYRMTAIPAFLVFAAFGGAELYDMAKGRLWRQAAVPLAIAAAALVFANLNVSGMDNNRQWIDAETHFYMGCADLAAPNTELACDEFREAISLDPNLENAHIYYAMVLARTGRSAEARQEALTGLRLCPDNKEANRNSGRVLMQIGDLGGALRCFQTASRQDPWSCGLLMRLAKEAERMSNPVICFVAHQTIADQTGMPDAQQRADKIRVPMENAIRQSFSPEEADHIIKLLRHVKGNCHVSSFFDPPQPWLR